MRGQVSWRSSAISIERRADEGDRSQEIRLVGKLTLELASAEWSETSWCVPTDVHRAELFFYSYESARQSHFRDLHAKSCRMKSSGFALVTGDGERRSAQQKTLWNVKVNLIIFSLLLSPSLEWTRKHRRWAVVVAYRHNKAIFGRVAKLCTPSQIEHRTASSDKTFFLSNSSDKSLERQLQCS